MLKHLQLQNFKSWQDTGAVRLAPLTVLFGTNSSGKSSLEQFFLMLRQTVASSDRKLVLHPGDAQSAVNLGSYEELVFRRNKRAKLEFAFEWELPESLVVNDPRSDFQFVGNRMAFSARVGLQGESESKLAVEQMSYRLKRDEAIGLTVALERQMQPKVKYKLTASPYELVRKQMKPWPLGNPTKFYGFPEEVTAYYQNADFVQDFSLSLEKLFRAMGCLGPLRSKGQRLYFWTGGEPADVGFSGEQTISAMLAAKERKLNTGAKKRYQPFQKLIAEQLQQLGLIDSFEVRQISANRKEYEVKVKTPGATDWVDLPDVGFGVSQVLPVLVQCFYAPHNSILFIEQPELHLHPKAQANLADLFIDVLSSREDGQPRNLQLIIETHSEHFLHRLQRRIAENNLDHLITTEQVAAYFAHTTGAESRLEPLQIDLLGNILNWPENFFGDSMGDLMAMTRAGAERQQTQPTTPDSYPAAQ